MPRTLDEYEVLSTIGSGSYGTCKKIRKKKDGQIYVWKELDYGKMSEVEKQMLVSEVNLLRELKHEHIVRYYDRIIDRSTATLYIVMEYCEGGDLATYISKMKKEGRAADEAFVWKICYQVVSALKECHCRNKNGKAVLHRDLKPANVFLDNQNNVKLGDFGLARVLSHDTSFANTFVGTPYYMSPEQMNFMSYNEKSDVWSLGCMLYELCALRPPFTASNQRELASRISKGQFQRIPLRYSDDLNDMITVMLRVEEFKRPEIGQLLEHPLMKKHCVIYEPRTTTDHSSGNSNDGCQAKLDLLKQKEQMLLEREKRLSEREKLVREREKLVTDREDKITKLEKDIIRRDRDITERERHTKRTEEELERRETVLVLREKMTDDRLARVDKLLDSPRPKLESTRKPVCRSNSVAEIISRERHESEETPNMDSPDTGRKSSLAGRTRSPHAARARPSASVAGAVPSKPSPTLVERVSPLLSPATVSPAVRSPSCRDLKSSSRDNRSVKDLIRKGDWRLRQMSGGHSKNNSAAAHKTNNKENIYEGNPDSPFLYYTASPERCFEASSPSLRMRLLSSPTLERKMSPLSPRVAKVEGQVRPHRKASRATPSPMALASLENLKDREAPSSPRGCSINSTKGCPIIVSPLDTDCILKEKVRRLLKKSPPDLYKARKDQRMALQPLLSDA